MFNLVQSPWVEILTTALGLIVGSFLNVVIVRLPKKQSIVFPASHCVKCKKEIRWYDNIPVISYLILEGKCRSCKKEISIRYPIIEVLTATVFLAAVLRFGWSWSMALRDLPFLGALIAVAFIDLEHRIIPDGLSLGGLALGLATCWLSQDIAWLEAFIGAGLGFGAFYGLAWLYQRLTDRSGLGGGDIKFLAMVGAFLGPGGVFATIFISSVVGTVVGLGWALLTKKKDMMKLSIPYGPFLVVGALYYYLLGDILWFRFMTPM